MLLFEMKADYMLVIKNNVVIPFTSNVMKLKVAAEKISMQGLPRRA
jgi:hypothetical protein